MGEDIETLETLKIEPAGHGRSGLEVDGTGAILGLRFEKKRAK